MKRVLIALIGVILVFGLFSCEAFDRGVQDFKSSISGLERVATVYSNDGDVIAEYSGRFDVETNDYGNKVKFDIDGRRIIIYNAIVIIEERE